jgi:hypothetical protein
VTWLLAAGGLAVRVPAAAWAGLAALALLVAVYLAGARHEAATAERDGLRTAIERREVRDEVDRDVSRDPAAAERLRAWQRD